MSAINFLYRSGKRTAVSFLASPLLFLSPRRHLLPLRRPSSPHCPAVAIDGHSATRLDTTQARAWHGLEVSGPARPVRCIGLCRANPRAAPNGPSMALKGASRAGSARRPAGLDVPLSPAEAAVVARWSVPLSLAWGRRCWSHGVLQLAPLLFIAHQIRGGSKIRGGRGEIGAGGMGNRKRESVCGCEMCGGGEQRNQSSSRRRGRCATDSAQ